jgi:hypothetical protein
MNSIKQILIILSRDNKIQTPGEVDQFVVAEIPPDPNDPEITNEEKIHWQKLQDIVLGQMVHGPCGDHCIKNNKCSKEFPKEFCNETALNSETNYAQYQRRSPNNNEGTVSVQTGQRNRIIDNRWIVPYNPCLLL